ncbi:MAG: T9SS type A sorting domain-containing protein, partial [Chitinophagales bacterium]|nr:T9SS type A sorting domain-containing protein [Chitinophagales bacterium]
SRPGVNKLRIYNTAGNLIYEKNTIINDPAGYSDIRLTPGVYVAVMTATSGESISFKFLVQ